MLTKNNNTTANLSNLASMMNNKKQDNDFINHKCYVSGENGQEIYFGSFSAPKQNDESAVQLLDLLVANGIFVRHTTESKDRAEVKLDLSALMPNK